MGFLDHVVACNTHDADAFLPFRVDQRLVGRVRPAFARYLEDWPELFRVGEHQVELVCREPGMEARSRRLARVLDEMVLQGLLSHLHGEQYAAVTGRELQPLLLVDRAAAPRFGIRAFGQHLNGYVRTGSGLSMWVGRRAEDRLHYPGCLDNLAAGGLPYGISLAENLAKECWEEAGIPAELSRRAVPVGAIGYQRDTEAGFKPDTLYCYDLELPQSFRPACMDGEVQAFYLMPVEEVMERVRDTQEFKLNCNLVIIDFLIRHGYIGPENEEYLSLVAGLHPGMPELI
ncbi:MAG: DUF4743 domain-containing protein [Sedimenticola sp.]|nr:DUF4743 domain-containing protein [Sedimenticola sp.]